MALKLSALKLSALKLYTQNIRVILLNSYEPIISLFWIFASKVKITNKSYFLKLKNQLCFEVRYGSNDIGMLLEFYRLNPYHQLNSFKIKDGDIVIDLGANIGVFTLNAALNNPNGIIYCFEPMEDNYQALTNNVNSNKKISTCIKMFEVAITNYNGTIDFNINKDSAFHSIVNTNSSTIINTVSVKCQTFSSFLNKEQIDKVDFLKVDIEGSEYDMIYSLTDSDFNKIRKIVFEVHPLEDGRNMNTLSNYLQTKNFEPIDCGNNMLYALNKNYK
jgi:FkbM family methyltransferase